MKERENKIITDEEYSSAQYRQILRIYAYSRENTRQIIIEKLLTIGWGGKSYGRCCACM